MEGKAEQHPLPHLCQLLDPRDPGWAFQSGAMVARSGRNQVLLRKTTGVGMGVGRVHGSIRGSALSLQQLRKELPTPTRPPTLAWASSLPSTHWALTAP